MGWGGGTKMALKICCVSPYTGIRRKITLSEKRSTGVACPLKAKPVPHFKVKFLITTLSRDTTIG